MSYKLERKTTAQPKRRKKTEGENVHCFFKKIIIIRCHGQVKEQ